MKTLKESVESESCDIEIENSNEFKLLNDVINFEIERYTNTISNTRDVDISATEERLKSFRSLKKKLDSSRKSMKKLDSSRKSMKKLDSSRKSMITNLNIAQLTSFRTAISGFYGRKKNELNEETKNEYLNLVEYFDSLIGKVDQNP